MSSFKYAQSKMREGGIVRRKNWGPTQAIMMEGETGYEWVDPIWSPPGFWLTGMRAGLEQRDLEADDWEVCGGYCP